MKIIKIPRHKPPILHENATLISFANCHKLGAVYKDIIGLENIHHFSMNIVDEAGKMPIFSYNIQIKYNIPKNGFYLYNGSISPSYYNNFSLYTWDEAYDPQYATYFKNNMERKNGINKGVVITKKFNGLTLPFSFATKTEGRNLFCRFKNSKRCLIEWAIIVLSSFNRSLKITSLVTILKKIIKRFQNQHYINIFEKLEINVNNRLLMARGFFIILLFFMKPLMATEHAWYFTPSDVNSLHSEPANVRISYGSKTLQFGDLRLPETNGLHPVAIIIHGGCWLSTFADLKNTAALADALRKMGIATWNIEYRRIDHEGGGWPGTFKDVADATDFLRQIDKKYSLDLNRVVVIGHSSGGHLALWLAGRHRLPRTSVLYQEKPLSLRGVIALGGVTDLKAFRDRASSICGIDVIGSLLGGNEMNYYDTSPIELLPFGISQRLICGKDDLAIDLSSNKTYVHQAKNLGDNAKFVQVKFAGHHEYNVPNSVTWRVILKEVLDILG